MIRPTLAMILLLGATSRAAAQDDWPAQRKELAGIPAPRTNANRALAIEFIRDADLVKVYWGPISTNFGLNGKDDRPRNGLNLTADELSYRNSNYRTRPPARWKSYPAPLHDNSWSSIELTLAPRRALGNLELAVALFLEQDDVTTERAIQCAREQLRKDGFRRAVVIERSPTGFWEVDPNFAEILGQADRYRLIGALCQGSLRILYDSAAADWLRYVRSESHHPALRRPVGNVLWVGIRLIDLADLADETPDQTTDDSEKLSIVVRKPPGTHWMQFLPEEPNDFIQHKDELWIGPPKPPTLSISLDPPPVNWPGLDPNRPWTRVPARIHLNKS